MSVDPWLQVGIAIFLMVLVFVIWYIIYSEANKGK